MSETLREALRNSLDEEPDTSVADSATLRDRIWDATLDLMYHRPIPFQAWRVRERAGLSAANDRTIRRTLTAMADAGWLEHEDNAKWWYLGPKAKERLHE